MQKQHTVSESWGGGNILCEKILALELLERMHVAQDALYIISHSRKEMQSINARMRRNWILSAI